METNESIFDILNPRLMELAKKRFVKPTDIQEKAIPEILKGKNVLVFAATGLGKTEACMLPIFNKLISDKHEKISTIYITPLKSLNRDMFDRLFWWSDRLGLEISIRHGDTVQKERTEQREMPPDILITTPETLQAILPGKKMKKHLSNVKYVIIDEVHELVSNKRGIQLSLGLERLKQISGKFQVIALSATIGSESKVANYIGNAMIIKSDANRDIEVNIRLPTPVKEHEKLEERLFIDKYCIARLMEIVNLIKKYNSVLVFTNTRQTAEVLSSRLREFDKEIRQDVHHGSLSKEARVESERKFKNQELRALIATSSLELGLDIGAIDLVIQYLSPRQVTKLIQRVGRSRHSVGENSYGILLSDEEGLFESAIINGYLKQKKLEETKIHENALDVLAHQIIGLTIDKYDITVNEIFQIVKNSYSYRNLKIEKLNEVLNFLSKLGLMFVEPVTTKVKRRKSSWQYYYENLSTIPDTHQYRIINAVTNEPIGLLDELFVAEHCETGNTFICKGRAWKTVQIEKNMVIVEPVADIESAIPSWEGELIPVPFEISTAVGELRRLIKNKEITKDEIIKKFNVDEQSINKMENIINKQKRYFVPDDKNILIETYQDFIIFHSCFGSLVNETIGRYVGTLLNLKYGVSLQMKTNPYSIIFKTIGKPDDIKEILENTKNVETTIIESLENSSLFKWRFIQVAKRFGVITKNAYFDKININKIISLYKDSPVYEETKREIFFEKLDIKNAMKVFNDIKNETIKIKINKGLSPMGKQNLLYQFSEFLAPKEPTTEIFKAFKRRLLNTSVILICMNCGKFYLTRKVERVENEPECVLCSSRLIGVINKNAYPLLKIVKDKFKGKKLSKAEEKEYTTIRRTADLTITYGKKAVICLAGHGIGPETATRILARLPKDEKQLLKYIFEAEKLFTRTHKYWK